MRTCGTTFRRLGYVLWFSECRKKENAFLRMSGQTGARQGKRAKQKLIDFRCQNLTPLEVLF